MWRTWAKSFQIHEQLIFPFWWRNEETLSISEDSSSFSNPLILLSSTCIFSLMLFSLWSLVNQSQCWSFSFCQNLCDKIMQMNSLFIRLIHLNNDSNDDGKMRKVVPFCHARWVRWRCVWCSPWLAWTFYLFGKSAEKQNSPTCYYIP